MRSFEILRDSAKGPLAIIRYDEDRPYREQWSGRLLEPDGPMRAPYVLRTWAERRGTTELGEAICVCWVQDRIMSFHRQLGGEVLKGLGLVGYSEPDLLARLDGRCHGDDFYVREVREVGGALRHEDARRDDCRATADDLSQPQ